MSLIHSSITDAIVPTGQSKRVYGREKQQALPRHQAVGFTFMPTVRTLGTTFPSNMFASAGKHSSVIPKIDYIHDFLAKVTHTVTVAPVTLAPSSFWFRQVDLRDSSTGKLIQTQYDDAIHANLLNRCSAGRERAVFKSLNLESSSVGKYGLAKPLPVGQHTFYVPMLTSIFENFGGLFLDDMEGDLSIDLTTPATIIAAGAGSISTSIELIVEGDDLSDSDRAKYRDRYTRFAAEAQFLQPIRSEFLNVNLTAGSSNNFLKLNNVDGMCAYQMILVRPTGAAGDNVGFNSWKLLNIGDSNGAAIDLVSSSGASIYGNGSPVPTRYLRQHASITHMDNDWVSQNPVYFLSYSEKMNAALAGQVNGCRRFKATDGDQIRLTLPAAPVNEVQTITFTQAPAAAGWISFSYKGEESARILANSSVAVVKSTIEAMKGMSSKYITVTASAVPSAGTSFTLTFVDPQGELVGDLVQCNTYDAAATAASTARTVAGVPGLATGEYHISVYSFMFNVAGYSNGRLTSELLLK
jgi:hypothetical protein